MNYLQLEHIVALHKEIVDESGGAHGILHQDYLEGALYSIQATFGGTELYPSLGEKAAVLCVNLTNAHAFRDGNKRIGVVAMMQFLMANDVYVNCSDQDLINLGLGIANHEFDYERVLEWIQQHVQKEISLDVILE